MKPFSKVNCYRVSFQVVLLISLLISFGCIFDDDDDNGSTMDSNETVNVIERVSFAFDGNETDDDSWVCSISSDGRFVAFGSYATNIVSGDSNEVEDIFIFDRETGINQRVSIASDSTQANGDSYQVAVNFDARFVAFMSEATNLVANDTNMTRDGFLFDRATGIIERYSVSSDSSEADDGSTIPDISADNRFVVFNSAATNLVPDDLNEKIDVFVKNRETDQTERVNIAFDGSEGDSHSPNSYISEDGKYIAYDSLAGKSEIIV